MSSADGPQQKDSTSEATSTGAPSQIDAYTIGAVSSDPTWKEQGQEMLDQGTQDLEEAQQKAKHEAAIQSVGGKLQSSVLACSVQPRSSIIRPWYSSFTLDRFSAYGFITGDQEMASQGNKKAEAAEWKAALADGQLPKVSLERAKGKVESAFGMVTGDIEKQQQGNMRAEKAAWTGA
ncbi:BQ2448_6902 [Microbotryum intermedium]|uniref:BQ2448_6902 protein n=1 Tax=Microbotryum intermedium TaxID=269621 RepID=A0A238FIA9_9BASI|nr:BQ2448_6902 [Microbotryum intermedium]